MRYVGGTQWTNWQAKHVYFRTRHAPFFSLNTNANFYAREMACSKRTIAAANEQMRLKCDSFLCTLSIRYCLQVSFLSSILVYIRLFCCAAPHPHFCHSLRSLDSRYLLMDFLLVTYSNSEQF